MLENELDNNRGPGDGSGGADHGAVSAGASRGGVSSRPAGPPDPAPPAPAVPAVSFHAPQVLFQAPQPSATPEAPPAAPSAEPAVSDDESGAPRTSSRRRTSSRAKADPEAAPPRQGGRGGRRGAKATEAKTAEDEQPAVAPDAEPTFSTNEKGSASPGADSEQTADSGADDLSSADEESDDGGEEGGQSGRRRRRRGGRSRSRGRGNGPNDSGESDDADDADDSADDSAEAGSGQRSGDATDEDAGPDSDDDGDEGENGSGPRRRRRKRRRGSAADSDKAGEDDPPDTVVHVREARPAASRTDDVRSVKGSTRLEAKRQRRREGRESGRRRPPVITEAEFLARREAVERTMVVRRRGDRTQIAVLEDDVLVEHYVNRSSHQSYVGNVYLGKVQNVLPSMEAAFVDIGKGRNAVLYAGEVNFDASGLEGQSKRIESALKSGQSILVQVTKDPVGHKGARLTSQVSLPGRYLVYVPGASMTGISRKLPDTERTRLKKILKKVMPEGAGGGPTRGLPAAAAAWPPAGSSP